METRRGSAARSRLETRQFRVIPSGRGPSGSLQVQSVSEVRPADRSNEIGVSADDELVSGTRQSDIEAFAGAFEGRLLVDDEHDRAALQTFEAEDVAVEHLLGVPEAVPVG